MSTKPRPLAPSTLAILNLPHHLPAWKAIAMPETDKLLEEAELKMEDSIDAIARSLASIRTGRANPALIEGLQIDYYGTSVTLNQLASISVPEARLLMVQPWDKRSIPAVEKSILKADLGLNPSSDGELIRIPIPALTDERRRDLAKLVNRRVEEGRVSVRTARRESVDQARSLKKAKEISEDEERRATEQLQKLTDSFVKRITDLGQAKEQELMES